ncbi:MAG: cytochrome c [Vicinamibacteria bacterium]
MVRSRSALLLLAALAAAGQAGAADPEAKQAARGGKIYLVKCAGCHGKQGQPVPLFEKIKIRALNDPEWHKARTDDEIRTSIAKGRPGTPMRAFEEELKAQEIDALVAFVRSLPPKP